MCFWQNLPKFVSMNSTMEFLPERKQADLRELVSLIREEIPDTVMVILYGSYARGTYVECDERRDFGVKTYYISDYDLLVVTNRRLGNRESTATKRIAERFMQGKDAEFQTRPQIITESIAKLNHALSEGRYFYVEIVNGGIVLYDSGKHELAAPRSLDFCEIKEMAQEYYAVKYPRAHRFLRYAQVAYNDEEYADCSFFLHQATEYFLKSIPLVYALYGYKEHELGYLLEKCKACTLELAAVFPQDTPEEKRLFELLQRAYVEARYNDTFEVTKADIDALRPKVELLGRIVEKICRERFAYYDRKIADSPAGTV